MILALLGRSPLGKDGGLLWRNDYKTTHVPDRLIALSAQRHRARGGTAMIVQSGELIDAGRGFPAEHFAGVAGAEKCFVGKPVEFPDAALGFGAKRNAGGIDG